MFTHLNSAKIYLHPPPPTHKKCPPASIQPKYIFTHFHLTEPTLKKCPSVSTYPQKKSTLFHPPKIYFTQHYPFPLKHKKCPPSSISPEFYLFHSYLLSSLTHKKIEAHPSLTKIYLKQTTPTCNMCLCTCTHPKYTILINA